MSDNGPSFSHMSHFIFTTHPTRTTIKATRKSQQETRAPELIVNIYHHCSSVCLLSCSRAFLSATPSRPCLYTAHPAGQSNRYQSFDREALFGMLLLPSRSNLVRLLRLLRYRHLAPLFHYATSQVQSTRRTLSAAVVSWADMR